MKRFLQVTSDLLLIVLLSAGCSSVTSGGATPGVVTPRVAMPSITPSPTPIPAADLKVTEPRQIKLDATRVVSLSPDGKWLAAIGDKTVCLIAVERLADKRCAELTTGSPDERTFVWSPDSTRLALTENLFRFMQESDIWTLTVDNGQLTDLTPDNVASSVVKLPKSSPALLDATPGWSPDSQTVIFSRTDRDHASTALYRVPAAGGAADKILDAPGQDSFAVWYGPRWLSNGKIVYNVAHPRATDPSNGVWLADGDGRNAKQLLSPDAQRGVPQLIKLSSKGDRALIWYSGASAFAVRPNVSYFAVLDLNSGQAVALKPSDPAGFLSVLNATFSPDGSKILYVYRGMDDQAHLSVRDVQSEVDHSLLIQPMPLGASNFPMQGLDWASNDTVYAATTPAGVGMLLTLRSK